MYLAKVGENNFRLVHRQSRLASVSAPEWTSTVEEQFTTGSSLYVHPDQRKLRFTCVIGIHLSDHKDSSRSYDVHDPYIPTKRLRSGDSARFTKILEDFPDS